jgi:hypothetical protein
MRTDLSVPSEGTDYVQNGSSTLGIEVDGLAASGADPDRLCRALASVPGIRRSFDRLVLCCSECSPTPSVVIPTITQRSRGGVLRVPTVTSAVRPR